MREIKFRAWDNVELEWYQPLYVGGGWLTRVSIEDMKKGVEPHVIGQYTGLKDKNGKEIYEGDVVITGGIKGKTKAVVKFDQHEVGFDSDCSASAIGMGFCFQLISMEEAFLGRDYIQEHLGREWANHFLGSALNWGDALEIIGNIYENPELLK